MRSLVYPTAVGCWALCSVQPCVAAEWSAQPSMNFSLFDDTNPRLTPDQENASGGSLGASVRLKTAIETSSFVLEPRFFTRRYDDSRIADVSDREIFGQFDHLGDRSQLTLSSTYQVQSTLLSELLETGVTRNDTNQHSLNATGSFSWMHTERRSFVSQFYYAGVSYQGPGQVDLPGYRYYSGSLGERFVLSERTSLTLNAVGNKLVSDRAGGSSHEAGVQAELLYTISDRVILDGSVGESRRFLYGTNSNGTNATVSLTRFMPRGNFALTYSRSLVPYGTGFAVERQQYGGSALYHVTPYLDAKLSLARVLNNETAELLGIDRRKYDTVDLDLDWQVGEHWTVGTTITGLRASAFHSDQDVKEWRGGLTLTWTPLASVISR